MNALKLIAWKWRSRKRRTHLVASSCWFSVFGEVGLTPDVLTHQVWCEYYERLTQDGGQCHHSENENHFDEQIKTWPQIALCLRDGYGSNGVENIRGYIQVSMHKVLQNLTAMIDIDTKRMACNIQNKWVIMTVYKQVYSNRSLLSSRSSQLCFAMFASLRLKKHLTAKKYMYVWYHNMFVLNMAITAK